LFSLPFLRENTSKKVSNLIRFKNQVQLFYNGDFKTPISVITNRERSEINYQQNKGLTVSITSAEGSGNYLIDNKLNLRFGKTEQYFPSIRKYIFLPDITFKEGHSHYLIPPYGYNLLNTLEVNTGLKNKVSGLFKEYKLSVVFDRGSQELKIMKANNNDADIFLVPYTSIADTLQRIIFYKTAIASNHDAVLLFEEPEAHSFPPYISEITQDMIDKKDSQFFISTHSPYILNELLEDAKDELAVFLLDYKDYQTVVNRLSEAELHQIYQDGVDLFMNNESYL
jgi:hypothetical protein